MLDPNPSESGYFQDTSSMKEYNADMKGKAEAWVDNLVANGATSIFEALEVRFSTALF